MAEEKDLTKAERIFVRISVMQTILALVGLFTGAIALYATLNESDAVRKQQEASVWPMVQMGTSDYDLETQQRVLIVNARNAGIGPARIAAFRVTIDGVAQRDWNEAITTLAGGSGSVIKSSFSGRVIAPGDSVDLVSVRGDLAAAALEKLYRSDPPSRLEWDVCYCSVFEKCWMVSNARDSSRLDAPEAVKKCPDYGDEQFQG